MLRRVKGGLRSFAQTNNEKEFYQQHVLSDTTSPFDFTPDIKPPPAYTYGAIWRKVTFRNEEEFDAKSQEDPATTTTTQGTGQEPKKQQLDRSLRIWDLIAYGIGSTVGAGIFVVTGVVAREKAGPAIVLSFLLAAFSSLMSAFCYAEFAARIPVSGSAYTFAYVTLGEIIGWLIGWNLTLEYALSASAVARGWSGYVVNFFSICHVEVPTWISAYSLNSIFSVSLLSVFIIGAMTILLLFGVKKSSTLNLIFTILNVGIILFVIGLGSAYVHPDNWDPFFPYDAQGAFDGAGTVFFSFIGFDSVTTLAGEVRNPSRDLPGGIVGTLGIATLLYVGVSLVITGMVKYDSVDKDAPLSKAFQAKGLDWAAGIIAAGSVTTLTSTTFASLLGQPRIFYQMAVDGLLPPLFKTLNKYQIPVWGTIITGVVAGTIAALFNLDDLADMISIGTLLAFTIVCGSVLVLRYSSPEHPSRISWVVVLFSLGCLLFSLSFKFSFPWYARAVCGIPSLGIFLFLIFQKSYDVPKTFKCPLVPLIPCIGILVNIYLMASLPVASFYRVLGWTAIGLFIYFTYGIRNSTLRFKLQQNNNNSLSTSTSINGSDVMLKTEVEEEDEEEVSESKEFIQEEDEEDPPAVKVKATNMNGQEKNYSSSKPAHSSSSDEDPLLDRS